tara:strand:+ start:189 stop:377 length:189 start_codon:yes stop_codon:yes gene_type:complete
MKKKNKKQAVKDCETRDNILFVELENLKQIVDSGLTMFTKYIKFKEDVDDFKQFLEKEAKDV